MIVFCVCFLLVHEVIKQMCIQCVVLFMEWFRRAPVAICRDGGTFQIQAGRSACVVLVRLALPQMGLYSISFWCAEVGVTRGRGAS